MHIDESEIYAGTFASKTKLVAEVDARIKIGFVFVGILINLLSGNAWTSVGLATFCLLALLCTEIPLRLLLVRLAMPLGMAVVVAMTQLFLQGPTPLFTVQYLHLTGYKEGLAQGILIMWRVVAGGALVLFLSLSTPTNKLFLAAGWFRMPQLLVELALLIYRYIFVLLEEMVTMKDAQTIRLGYHGWRQSMNSLSVLGGSLILRAYDRAERVFEAMLVRGYTGDRHIAVSERLHIIDYLAAAVFAAILAGLYCLGLICR